MQRLKSWVSDWNPEEFTPKLFTLLREGISIQQVRRDVLAGVTVGIVALPLAIAFAIASGVSPEKGLITAIFAGFIISAFGGSRVQIGGPTGAFIVIVYGIVQQYGIEGLTFATFIAGFMLMGMGLLRFGTLLKYIPHPLIVGFTSGIAVIIFSSQIRDFFGLSITSVPSPFLEKWEVYFRHFQTLNPIAVGIGVATVLIVLYFSRITGKVPGSLVAIVAATAAVQLLHLPVETIESKFGEIPRTIPAPAFYTLDFQAIKSLLSPAFAIALLGGIESLLSAVVADGMTGGRHRSNIELVAQGAANVVSSIFGGIPATGAIARTATNVKNGGRTPIAGITHAVVLLGIMLIAAPWAKLIPLSCLAGILVVVAWNMGEWSTFRSVYRGNYYDRLVLLVVFFLTVIFDLIVAIEIGVVLSAFLFIRRMTEITHINVLESSESGDERLFEKEFAILPRGVMLFEVSGPLFFGASRVFQNVLSETRQKPRAIVFNLRKVPIIDATGLYRLAGVVKKFHTQGVRVFITGFNAEVGAELAQAELHESAWLEQDVEACINNVRSSFDGV